MNSERPTNGIDTPDDDTELRALLAPFADVLGSEAMWAEPPAGLVDSIVDQLRSTDAEVVALAPPVSITPPSPPCVGHAGVGRGGRGHGLPRRVPHRRSQRRRRRVGDR